MGYEREAGGFRTEMNRISKIITQIITVLLQNAFQTRRVHSLAPISLVPARYL